MQKKKAKENAGRRSPYDLIKGKEVSFQLLRGTIIEGTFAGFHDRFFIVTNAVIKGKKHVCKTDLAFIHVNQVQHFHLKGEVKEITG